MNIPKSTVRLAAVIKACGKPQSVTLWTTPDKEPGFKPAVKQNRVLTLVQRTGAAKKDFGVVGFHREANASFWIFPKRLDAFQGKRVVGVDYSFVEKPLVLNHAEAKDDKPGRRPPRAKLKTTPPPAPTVKKFNVIVRSVASVEIEREVEAETAKKAREVALKAAADAEVGFSKGKVSHKVVQVKEL